MAEQRLPVVDGDDGVWGEILNQYIGKEHYNTGLDNADNGGHQTVTIRPGTTAAGTAPLKILTGGSLMTTPEAGALEAASDQLYYTIPTGTSRRFIPLINQTGAVGDIYYRNASSELQRLAAGSTNDLLTISGGNPTWQSFFTGTSHVTVGTSAPSSPATGDIWIDTN